MDSGSVALCRRDLRKSLCNGSSARPEVSGLKCSSRCFRAEREERRGFLVTELFLSIRSSAGCESVVVHVSRTDRTDIESLSIQPALTEGNVYHQPVAGEAV